MNMPNSQYQTLTRSSYSLGAKGTHNLPETGAQTTKNSGKLIEAFDFNQSNDIQEENNLEKQNTQDKLQKAIKVNQIYERLQDRLKLRRKDSDTNFRKIMSDFRQLDTFIDTRQQIQDLNLAFQKGFKSSLEVLKIRDKIQLLNKELKDSSAQYQLQYGDHEVIDEQIEDSSFQKIKGKKHGKELLNKSKQYLQSQTKNFKTLETTQAITDTLKQYIQKEQHTVNQIDVKDDIHEFYNNLEYIFEKQKKLLSLKEFHDELERKKQEEKEKKLREQIKESKFEMNNENEKTVPNQGYFEEYHRKTEQTISKAVKESRRIYRQKLGLISQREKLFLDIKENIIDKKLDKPQQIDINDKQSVMQSPSKINSYKLVLDKQSSTPQLKPLIKSSSKNITQQSVYNSERSSIVTPQKPKLSIEEHSFSTSKNKLTVNVNTSSETSNLPKIMNPLSKFNQTSKTSISANEIQIEQQLNNSQEKSEYFLKGDEIIQNFQSDQVKKAEKKLSNIIFSPILSDVSHSKLLGNSTILTDRRNTQQLTITLNNGTFTEQETRHQSINENQGSEFNQFSQSYFIPNGKSNVKNYKDLAKQQKDKKALSTTIGYFRNESLEKSSFALSSESNSICESNLQNKVKNSLMTRAQQRQLLTDSTPIIQQSIIQTPTSVEIKKKKSLGTLSEEVSQLVKQMTFKSPSHTDIRRLSNIFSPKSTMFQIEKRNIFLTHIGSQQDTVKQFINKMKQAETTYKEEKIKLMDYLQEVKQQYITTQEKYEDPKISSIRDVQKNEDHKYKNFLRRNYKPKAMQTANQ